MLFKLMKKWEKIVVYKFNIGFALIFCKWKMVLRSYFRHKKLIFICNIQYIYIYYMISHLILNVQKSKIFFRISNLVKNNWIMSNSS